MTEYLTFPLSWSWSSGSWSAFSSAWLWEWWVGLLERGCLGKFTLDKNRISGPRNSITVVKAYRSSRSNCAGLFMRSRGTARILVVFTIRDDSGWAPKKEDRYALHITSLTSPGHPRHHTHNTAAKHGRYIASRCEASSPHSGVGTGRRGTVAEDAIPCPQPRPRRPRHRRFLGGLPGRALHSRRGEAPAHPCVLR